MSQSVDRALLALESLGTGPASITEVAARLRVHDSTALRLLRMLETRRFVSRGADRRYRLGPALLALAHQAMDRLDIRQVARPYILALSEQTGYTVHVGEFADGEVVYIDKVDGKAGARMYSKIGKRAPLHCTAIAKAIVAHLPESERVALTYRMDYRLYTPATIQGPEAFLHELAKTRAQGYATDNSEHEPFIRCVAAPIRDAAGQIRHAISMAADFSEQDGIDPDDTDVISHAGSVIAAATSISGELGWTATDDRGQLDASAAGSLSTPTEPS